MKKKTKKNDGGFVNPNLDLRNPNIKFVFFGTSHIAVYVLDALERAGLTPLAVVTTPDTKQGRGLTLTLSPIKKWALERDISVHQPEKIGPDVLESIRALKLDVAILVDYGKIIPKKLLEIPRRGFLNVHPSLLPRLRGPSPMRSAILNDEKTGVSIMLMDEKMDHGPIVAQKKVEVPDWPPRNSELERILLSAGGTLLAQILSQWIAGEIDAREQNHDVATYSAKIRKEDGLLDLNGDGYKNLLKIRALEGWPGTYAFFERASKQIRAQILDAHLSDGTLIIDNVKPEGKREMPYEEFLRSGAHAVA